MQEANFWSIANVPEVLNVQINEMQKKIFFF